MMALCIFLIFFTPLVFGSVYVWAFSVLEFTVFSMLIALVVRNSLIKGRKFSFPFFSPIVAFLSLILFQLTPLPPFALKLVSPKTYELYSYTLDGYPGEMMEDRGKRAIVGGTEPIGQRLEVGGKTVETKKTEGYGSDRYSPWCIV